MKLRNKKTGEIVDVESLGHADSLKGKFGYQVTLSWKIDEHLDTIYGNIRFGGRRLNMPSSLTPEEIIEPEEMSYISALLEAYSDELNITIETTEALKAYDSY